jgi:dihydroxyacid dehydratase/phosphogluconate dehydratase
MVKLQSGEWYAGDDRNAYLHRAWMRRGVPASAFSAYPQIAIANTASDLTPCNSHLNEVAEAVKQGVHEAGADLDFLVGASGPAVTRESH